jgi:exonuclease III
VSGGNDRLVAINLKGMLNLVICSVHFPLSNRSVSEFKETLDELEQFFYEQKANGKSVVIMEDFNAHFQSGQTLNARGNYCKLC